MTLAITILLLLTLLVTFIQDVRERAVYAYLLIAIAILGIVQSVFQIGFVDSLVRIALNFGWLVVLITPTFLYWVFVKSKSYSFVNGALGIGDIVYFLAICSFFSLQRFIAFTILGLVFCLLIHLLFSLSLPGYEKKRVPLAGLFSLFIGIIYSTELLILSPLIDEHWMYKLSM